jgi:epoxyqueuosine reductase
MILAMSTEPSPAHTAETTTEKIKKRAAELGFDACGITDVQDVDPQRALRKWLDRGFHADMQWMEKNADIREDITRKLPDARSVVVVARNYYHPRPDPAPGTGQVSRYAWGRDYHNVLRKPLIKLARYIESLQDDAQTYRSLDTGPVLERAWAQRAGVGSIGKNTLALRRDLGSWFFLGTVAVTIPLTADSPSPDLCGTCRACLDACPTHAFPEPYVLDSNRCISYQTIENRGTIPPEMHEAQGDWIFGCDICQEVCPWNRFARQTDETDFRPRPGQANPELPDVLNMDESEFNETYQGSPIRRTRHSGFLRNAKIVEENQT